MPTTTTSDRPIAGIIVASVLAIIGLLWSGVMVILYLFTEPAGPRGDLLRLFPGLRTTDLLSGYIGLAGCAVLLVGALLSFARHPGGNRTVRITCYSMLILLLLLSALSLASVVGSSQWSSLDPGTRTGTIVGIVVGVIGGALQWCIILFLFRKKRWNQ